ncbi:LOW QUALITY PROTEIN: zinc finger protein 395 [Falco naumanni]|uniref:LOW QUALITY PROTEIN: zinc finger protein 395 n=1 Tax=Falco naumanni TaxID=148594 RepID=UPI001ADEADE1|nr:LOW QUALITY PROTEIN: zinc finger protein 395 [Falco naumanni]
MASVLSRRLGKRSLLGTRVSAPSALADGVLVATQIPSLQTDLGRAPAHTAPREDGSCVLSAEESSQVPRFPSPSRWQLRAGQQVLITYNGQECTGLVEQHNPLSDKVKVLLPEQGLQACWRVQDVRPAILQPPALPTASGPGPAEALQRSVSSSIDVPKRKADAAVEMDEMVAAMVLTSLSCSPVVQSPPASESGIPSSRAACDPWKESGDVSDSGSSTTSGHWSGGSDISTPSPPHPAGSPKYSIEALSSPQADDGFETDSDPFLLDEPAPRKRKNSVKVMYKCLWPSCGKVLRSIVGIKRHVKTQHLGDGADSDQRKREEDFYYTEVQVKEEPVPEAATATSPTSVSAPIIIQQALGKPEALLVEQPALEPALASSTLSQSAPSSFWHIQADHAYQALPSIQIPVSPHIFTSISWATATSTLPSLSPVRSRSLSFSEPQPPTPMLKSHLIVASPPRVSIGTRKVRGEAKKCRKVYGIEHRDQWCTACRWKKACQRFLD